MSTIAEKIFARASGKGEAEAGDIVMADIDIAMMHDLTGPLAVESFEKIGTEKVWDSSKIVIPFDHQVPADSLDSANNHILMRKFVKEQGIENFYDVKEGVCHQVLPEKGHVIPGTVIVGADSHTCNRYCRCRLTYMHIWSSWRICNWNRLYRYGNGPIHWPIMV